MLHAAMNRALDAPLRAGESLDGAVFAAVRRRMQLDGFKWDPQIGDHSALAPFPLLLSSAAWAELRDVATRLAHEVLSAECEVLHRPALHSMLTPPRAIVKLFEREHVPTAGARIMRLDFHWTTEGWRISEVNSDVPGGFTEASTFARLVAEAVPGARPAGDPGARWVETIARAADGGEVALVSAPGYLEDHQVVAFLADGLASLGVPARLVSPSQIQWPGGRARLGRSGEPLGAIVRFYQAEWLPARSWRRNWCHFFVRGLTPVLNPGVAVFTESKRFPLVWPSLRTPLPTWRAHLPETRDPRDAPWERDDGWLVKSAYCNTGDSVAMRQHVAPDTWRSVARAIARRPSEWIAQRRFMPIPVASPVGPVYPCIGVYVMGNEVTGIYGRVGAGPVINGSARDIAVLVEAR